VSESAPNARCLRAQGLHKRYGRRTVVHDVSLQVRGGEVVGLLGPNGAGKTTSFYMIVGLVRADAGRLWIDDQPAENLPIHRRARLGLGYLPQEASIFRKLTVEQNVRAVLELQHDEAGRPLAEPVLRERLDRLLQELHVDHLRDAPAPALSGGERRRVEIARALATNPRFILLDEPFAGVDPIAVIEIQRIIGFLKARGIGGADHRPQCARDAGHLRPRLHHQRGTGARTRHARRHRDDAEVRRVYLGEHFRL
jgi:lipopolysaccharide export system ATP-binding protein